MATLTELTALVSDIIQDESFSDTTIKNYLNRGLREIAGGVVLPDNPNVLTLPLPELYTIGTVTTSTTNAYVSLPADYQRDLVFCVNADGLRIGIYNSFLTFMDMYPALDHVGGEIQAVAVKGSTLFYQPQPWASVPLTVHYHKAPTALSAGTDTPSCLPLHLHESLLVNFACKEIFRLIEDGDSGRSPNAEKYMAFFFEAMKKLEATIPVDGESVYFGYAAHHRGFSLG